MVTRLESLRVEAAFDASAYVAGAQAKAAADQAMVRSAAQTDQAVAVTERRVATAGKSVENLARRHVEGARAAAELETAVNRLARAVDADNSVMDRSAQIYESIVRKTGLFADAQQVADRGHVAFAKTVADVNVRLAAQAEAIQRVAEAQRRATDAAQAQASINARLGVQDAGAATGNARASADAFLAAYGGLDAVAKERARHIAETFTAELNTRLVTGIGKSARESASAFQEAFAAQDAMAKRAGDLRAQINPLGAALDRLNAELEEYRGLAAAGAISTVEMEQAQSLATRRYDAQVRLINLANVSVDKYKTGVGLARHELINFSRQVQDVGVSLASGQAPMTVLIQQGTQIADIFAASNASAGGFVAQLGRGLRSIVTPFTVATAGVVALGIGLGVVLARAGDMDAEARAFGVTLRAMGADAQVTTSQLHAMVEAMRDLGVSRDAARSALMGAIRVPGAASADITQAAGLAPDFAAGFGVTVEDATKKLVEMGVQGFAAIRKLDEAYDFLTPAQLAQVRLLTEQGDKAGAVALAYEAMGQRVRGAALDAMSPAAVVMHDLGRAITGLIDSVAGSETVMSFVRALTEALKDMSGANKAVNEIRAVDKQLADLMDRMDRARKVADSGTKGSGVDAARASLGALRAEYDALLERRLDLENPLRHAPMSPYYNAAAADYGGGNEAAGTPYGKKTIDDLTAAYEHQHKVLAAGVGIREAVRAKEEAIRQAQENGATTTEAAIIGQTAYNKAVDQMSATARDAAAATSLEVQGLRAVAAAYAVGEAAGKAMEATVRAQAEAHRNAAVNVEAAARRYQELASAQALIDVTRQASAMQVSAEAARAATAAAVHGTEASQEAARAAEVEAVKRTALAAAVDADRAAVTAQIEKLDEESRARLKSNQELERATSLRQANQQAAIAAMQAEAAAIGDPDLRRAAELRIERQQKINELVAKYKDLNDEAAQAQLRAFDATQASREQVRFWNEVRSRAESVSSDISQFLVDGFVNAEKGGKSAFENLWEGALAGVKRLIANIAAEFVKQRIIMPVVMQIIGSNAGVFGISQPGGGGGGVNILDLFDKGKQAYDLFNGAGSAASSGAAFYGASGTLSQIGPTAALSPAGDFMTATFAADSAGGSLAAGGSAGVGAMGVIGGIGAGFGAGMLLNSVIGGDQTGGMIGAGGGALAGAAIGSVIPGVGTVIGALIGGLIGGGAGGQLFGGGKPSVGDNFITSIAPGGTEWGAATNPDQQFVGKYFQTYGAMDNASDQKFANEQAQRVVTILDGFMDAFKFKLNDKAKEWDIATEISAVISNFTNPKKGNSGDRQQGFQTEIAGILQQKGIQSLEQATADVFLHIVKRGFELGAIDAAPGVAEGVKTMFENIDLTNLDAIRQFTIGMAQLNNELFKKEELTAVEAGVKKFREELQQFRLVIEAVGLSTQETNRQAGVAYDEEIRKQIQAIEDPVGLALEIWERDAEARLDLGRELGSDLAQIERLNALERKRIVEQSADNVIAAEQRIAQSRVALETQLLNALGETDMLRARTLAGTEDALKPIQEAIFAAQDWMVKVNEAQAAVTAAEATLAAAREQAAQAQIASLRDLVNQFDRFAKSLRDFRTGLLTSGYSPYGPREQLGIARAEFEDVARRAQLGDVEAIGKLQDTASRFLDASRAYNASSEAYFEDFSRVQAVLAATADVAERQADINRSQLTELERIHDATLSVADATAAVEAAVANLARVMAEKPDPVVNILNQLNQYGTTDPNSIYLQQNPDVQAAWDSGASWTRNLGSTPGQFAGGHYSVYGAGEGRTNPDPGVQLTRGQKYMQNNPDVLAAYQSMAPWAADMSLDQAAAFHYSTWGKNEGRAYRAGGWVANGAWDRDSVRAVLAGGEAVIPAPAAAMFRPQIDAMLGGRQPANDNGAIVAELRDMNKRLARMERLQAAVGSETIETLRRGSAPQKEALKEARRQAARPLRDAG